MSDSKGLFAVDSNLPPPKDKVWSEVSKSDDVVALIDENRKFRGCSAVAELETGAEVYQGLQTRLGSLGLDLDSLLDDPECEARVKELANRADMKSRGAHKQAARVMQTAMSRLEEQLKDPGLSSVQLRDILETSTRIKGQLDKQPDETEPVRRMSFNLGIVSIDTPEGYWGTRIESIEDVIAVIRLMRCSDESEVEAVIQVIKEWMPEFYHGDLTLRGW